MNHYLVMSGVILNLVLTLVNRFVYRLPNWLQIPLLLIGITLMIAGFFTL